MIIFDLDGTLADCEHRRHFVDPKKNCNAQFIYDDLDDLGQCLSLTGNYYYKGTENRWKPNWKAFFEACDQDKVIIPVKSVLIQYCHREIEIWSGRCESVRKKTENWLSENIFDEDIKRFKNIKLKMRPIGDSTPDDELKERWLDELITSQPVGYGYMRHPVDFVVDDRPKVCRMWRRRGIFVFDVNQSGKEF